MVGLSMLARERSRAPWSSERRLGLHGGRRTRNGAWIEGTHLDACSDDASDEVAIRRIPSRAASSAKETGRPS
jgi:hypothetical protein